MALFRDPHPVVVAHQGAARAAVPNTLEAFARAVDDGATWVELDARRAADGAVVLHHDPETPDGVPIVTRDGGTLGSLGLHRLDAVLDALPPGVGVDVDLKNLPGEPDYDPESRLVGLVADVVAPHVGARPLAMTSFNPETIVVAAEALPDVPTGLIVMPTFAVDAAAEVAEELGARLLCPHAQCDGLDPTTVAAVRAGGLELMVWTVNDAEQARTLADAGVDALCTDDPAGLLAALR
jgi:glycerophosphoryl diester phosphodiesterase